MCSAKLRHATSQLVQATAEPSGATVDAVRDALSWLAKCSRDHAGHCMHMVFKFTPDADTRAALKLKVEINTREHRSALEIKTCPFAVENGWRQGNAEIASFTPEEMFGTNLRALGPSELLDAGSDAGGSAGGKC